MEQCNHDPVKSPVIQEIILSNRIAVICDEIARRMNVTPLKALEIFYASKTCEDLHNKDTGLKIGLIYMIVGIADFMYQKHKFAQQLVQEEGRRRASPSAGTEEATFKAIG